MSIEHSYVDTNGITVHVASLGEGPLVVFCHGFPDSWYAWRHQLQAVAEAGYQAVALDMRGYGETTSPLDPQLFTLAHNIGDVIGVIHALGHKTATVVGHDWGGPVAWYSALMRPDIVTAVAVLSTPYRKPGGALPDGLSTNDLLRRQADGRDLYRLYFLTPDVPESEHDANPRDTILGYLYTFSGNIVADGIADQIWDGFFPKGERMVDQLVLPDRLPPWLNEHDLDYYASRFALSGFRGGINWYRQSHLIPAILAPFKGTTVSQPSMFVAGELDFTTPMGPWEPLLESMKDELPDLRLCELWPGAGHWLQQEHANDVNDRLLGFLASL